MVYLKHDIYLVEIHHSGWKPSIFWVCDIQSDGISGMYDVQSDWVSWVCVLQCACCTILGV